MERLQRVRQEVDEILLGLDSDENRRCGFVHLYGVSLTATWLAVRRDLDPELAALAGLLHDLANYTHGESRDHAAMSSDLAAALLEGLGLFSPAEVATVAHAIARHSQKGVTDEPMDELLKDADVLHHWLYDPGVEPLPSHAARRTILQQELRRKA